jgi:hypothetical protein
LKYTPGDIGCEASEWGLHTRFVTVDD